MKRLLLILSLFLFGSSCQGKKETYEKPGLANESGENLDQKSQENAIVKTGMQIAQATQQQLGKNLIAAIGEGGTLDALDFCNVEAIPLTAEMEKEHQVKIKRFPIKIETPIMLPMSKKNII